MWKWFPIMKVCHILSYRPPFVHRRPAPDMDGACRLREPRRGLQAVPLRGWSVPTGRVRERIADDSLRGWSVPVKRVEEKITGNFIEGMECAD